ncbi:hypothetical protein V2J09_023545 [Rumex salicifolius]
MMESSSCLLSVPCGGFHIRTSGLLFFIIYALFSYLTFVEAFDARIELPRSGHVSVKDSSRAKRVFHVDDYGAIGDGVHDDTKAFKRVWKAACSQSPWSKIVVSYGNVYLVRQVEFSGPCQAKVVFQILGTIVAPKDPSVWLNLDPTKWIYFHGLKYLTVEGGGKLNGMGKEWWDQSCKTNSSLISHVFSSSEPCHHAPTAITFHRCNNLVVTDLTLIDSPQMHMTVTDCTRVQVSNMSLVAPSDSPNTDGIHITSSKNVVVRNSVIKTGDDCISIVNNSSKIQIRNIACGPGHGISIGSLGKYNSCSVVHDVVVDGALLIDTKNGVRVKTWQGGMGFAANITFKNVLMENVLNPIIVDQYYCDAPYECQNQTSAVKVEGVSFISIKGTTSSSKAIKFACSDNFPCDGLYLEDIQLLSRAKPTSSFCWAARGSSSGLVIPPPCFDDDQIILGPKVSSYVDPGARPSNLSGQGDHWEAVTVAYLDHETVWVMEEELLDFYPSFYNSRSLMLDPHFI